jgi:phage terminase small subunit
MGRAKGELTPKQKMFVKEYLVDLNCTQAMIRAGYSKKGAEVQGSKLLRNPKVADALQKALEKRHAKLDISAERIDQETARLAFFDIRKLYRPDGTLIPITELDEDTARAISGVEVSQIGSEQDGIIFTKKYKTASKEKALELLYRRLGLLLDRTQNDTELVIKIVGGNFDRMRKKVEQPSGVVVDAD